MKSPDITCGWLIAKIRYINTNRILLVDRYNLESTKLIATTMVKFINNITNFAVENGNHAKGSKKTNSVGGFHAMIVKSSPVCI